MIKITPINDAQRPGLGAVWVFVAVSARQLKPLEKLKLKLTTKSQIEFGQARYKLIVAQLPIVIPFASLAANLLLCVGFMSTNFIHKAKLSPFILR